MKPLLSILFFLFINICSFGQNNNQVYHLSWDGISTILRVKLKYTPTSADSTVFEYGNPNFGGQLDIFEVVKNIRCELTDKLKIDKKARKITIYHRTKSKKTLLYEIDGEKPSDKKPSIYTELFRPVITKDFLCFVTDFFMLNRIQTTDSNEKVSIIWDEFPRKFTYFNSIQPTFEKPGKKQTTTKFNLNERMLFVMGKEIVINKYDVQGIPYYSISSNNTAYKDLKTELPPFFKDYFPSIRTFWNDNDNPFYFVAVLPIQYADPTRGGGFGMKNGFLMKYLGDFKNWEKLIIAHETSHNWIGLKMIIGEDNFDHQWFGEGFNDYVTLINLAKSKIYDSTAFLDYLNNDNFELHYTSPVKDSSNASIAKNYWTDYKNFGKLPYRRGLIYAFYLDNQIRLSSNGKFTLRNLLLDFLALRKSKKEKEILTIDDFMTLGAKYIPKEQFKNEIETYMIQGKPIDFHHVKLISEFQLYFNGEIPQIKLAENADLLKIYN